MNNETEQLTLDRDIWSGKTFPALSAPTKDRTSRRCSKKSLKSSKKTVPIFLSLRGGWHYSGCIVGDGFSVAWRVFDAQFWGVPQRRRRIALVADFGGCTAPEILFERKGVSRYTPPSGTLWETFAAAAVERFGGANQKRGNGDGQTGPTMTGDHENRVTDYTSLVCTRGG